MLTNSNLPKKLPHNLTNSKTEPAVFKEAAADLTSIAMLPPKKPESNLTKSAGNEPLSPKGSATASYDLLVFTLQKIWGKNFKSNLSLVKKAIAWLELNAEEHELFLLPILQKLITLGTIISEEENVKGENSTSIPTKEAAKQERSQLTSNKEFFAALTNKSHPLHKASLAKIKHLNQIIAS